MMMMMMVMIFQPDLEQLARSTLAPHSSCEFVAPESKSKSENENDLFIYEQTSSKNF